MARPHTEEKHVCLRDVGLGLHSGLLVMLCSQSDEELQTHNKMEMSAPQQKEDYTPVYYIVVGKCLYL